MSASPRDAMEMSESLVAVEFVMGDLSLGWDAYPGVPMVGDLVVFPGMVSEEKAVVRRRWRKGTIPRTATMDDAGLYGYDRVFCQVEVADA